MAFIVFAGSNKPVVEREPYASFLESFDKLADNLEGQKIELTFVGKDGMDGSAIFSVFGDAEFFEMSYEFSEVCTETASSKKLWYIKSLVRCAFYESEDMEDHIDVLEKYRDNKLENLIYIDGLNDINFTYYVDHEFTDIIFDILVDDEEKIKSVCLSFLSYIVALFAMSPMG